MIKSKTKTIKDGNGTDRSVSVLQFAGTRANKNFVRFQQCFSGNQITCSPDEWQTFCNEFLSGVQIDGKEVTREGNFDEIFSGNISFLLEVVLFTAEANFGSSFLASGTGNTSATSVQTTEK